jgi:hypothetical protein
MTDIIQARDELLQFVEATKEKYELSKTVGPDYYEPGMMENLDQYYGNYDSEAEVITIRTDVKGLRYENRTRRLDKLSVSDEVLIKRDKENTFNANNFNITNAKGESLGTLSAPLCNALAPLYDAGYVAITESKVSYIEKLSERSRYAQQGVLFVELKIKLLGL